MEKFSDEELREAYKAIASMISKCEKAQEKETLGVSQRTLLINRIRALRISAKLITRAMENSI